MTITSLRTLLLCLVLLMAGGSSAYSQFRITINLRNPPPAEVATWRDDPSVITVMVEALDRDYPFVYMGIDVINQQDGGVYARSRMEPSMRQIVNLRRNVPQVFNGSQIIETRNIDYPNALGTRIATAGVLPEGQYLFCIRLYDGSFRELTGSGTNNCQPFTIMLPTQLQLRLPLADAALRFNTPNVFSWTPLTMRTSPVQYRMVIAPVFENQTALNVLQQTFDRALPAAVDVTVPTTEYTLLPFHAALQQYIDRRAPRVTGFAWQVQAIDMFGRPIAQRGSAQGKSDYRLFTFESTTPSTADCTAPLTLEPYFPQQRDTIPWLAPHIIVRWGPFCNHMNGFTYALSVRDASGTALPGNMRSLTWGSDVLTAQGIPTTAPNAEERARLIVTNWRDELGGTPALNAQLQRGGTYTWTIEGMLDRRGGSDRFSRTTAPSTFTVGLRTPQTPVPANDARVDAAALTNLSFTIPAPQTVMFSPADLNTVRRTDARMEFGMARERMRIVLSRQADCSAPIAQHMQWVGAEAGYTTGDASISEMFGSKNMPLERRLEAGTYYWRVEYLDWQRADRVYRQGPIWRFVIESEGPDAAECVRLFATAPENRSTIGTGTELRFSISTNPRINLDAVRSGRVRVWQMRSSGESAADARSRPVLVERSFTGHADRDIVISPGIGSSATRSYFNLPFMNGAVRVTENTSYLWDVVLDVEGRTVRNDGVTCTATSITSAGNTFTVRNDQQCNDACQIPESQTISETPSTRTYAVGDRITIGRFTARLTQVSGTAAGGLRGEASVQVPLFNGAVAVEFTGLKVNTSDVVYDGEMTAKSAPSSPIDARLANTLQGPLGLSRSQIDAVWSHASEAVRLVSMLAGSENITMPLGFDRVIDGERYVLAIMGMVFKPRDARLNVVAGMDLPWLGPDERLSMGVRNMCFQPNGFGREVEIALMEDLGHTPSDSSWSFHFLAGRDADTASRTPADSGTYIRFGCRGFEALRIKAEVRFPRTWMIPVTATGTDRGDQARATLATTIRRGGGFFAEATMDRFSPVDVPDFVMQVDSMVVDMSDTENAASLQFPVGYRGELTNRWRGFYINRLTMRLPDAVRTFDSTRPMNVDVRHMLIDKSGFSMQARVNNIVQYPRGNFGSWGGSLDTLGISFVNSSFAEGRLVGRLKTPISDSVLDYRAVLNVAPTAPAGRSRVGFQFSIRPRGTINAPLWLASLTLAPTSYILMETDSTGRFRAIGNFSGSLTISGDAPRASEQSQALRGLDIRGVTFSDLRFQTHAQPYVGLRDWHLASPQHAAAGFPLEFTGWSIRQGTRTVSGVGTDMPSVGLQLGAKVVLQRGTDGISGDTRLTFWGSMNTTGGGPPSFVFGGVSLDEIGIDADMKAVKIAGRVQFYNGDSRFGDGFRGQVSATFVKLLQVDATVQFGALPGTSGYNYWYVDARGILQAGVPLFSGVAMYGFGGGAWYNMRRESPAGATGSYTFTAQDRAMLSGTGTARTSDAPGSSPSGTSYIPDRPGGNDVFGFYALMTLGTHPKADAFNCDLRLTAEFTSGPSIGVRSITLDGQGYMMTSLTERAAAPITMNALLSMDFQNERFTGVFGINIRYPKTSPTLFADGNLHILIERSQWHFKLGTPPYTPNGRIRMSLGGDGLDASNALLSLNAYLMAGTALDVPFLRPPAFPEDMWSRLQGRITRPPLAANRGDGFALGASLAITPPELRFLIFYANFRFVAGFDLSILNVGRQSCLGRDAIGINGWYSRGQVYGYISGGVGLYADLGFWEGRMEIASVTMGALLEGGTPNPMWLSGAVDGTYTVLGGLLQGSFNFQFAVGERCVPARDIPLPLSILTDISPADGAVDVSVIARPAVMSNYAFNQTFDLIEMYEGTRTIHTYRIVPESFTLARADAPSTLLGGSISVDTYYPTMASYTLQAPLRYSTEYSLMATARAEKAIGWRGGLYLPVAQWETARRRTGEEVRESISSRFTTEAEPDTLVPEQVWNTYPRNRQRFFLQDECRQGFIQVAGSYAHLFYASQGGKEYDYIARFMEIPGGTRLETPAVFTSGRAPGLPQQPIGSAGTISFQIPSMRPSGIYAAQIVRKPRQQFLFENPIASLGNLSAKLLPNAAGGSSLNTRVADNIQLRADLRQISSGRLSQIQQTLAGYQNTSLTMQQRRINAGLNMGRTVDDGDKLLFVFFFRNSQFNYLSAKMRTLRQLTAEVVNTPGTNIALINGTYGGPELFDPHDMEQVTVTMPRLPGPGGTPLQIVLPPLITVGANNTSSPWHRTFSQPQIYGAVDAMRYLWSPLWSPDLWVDRVRRTMKSSTGMEYRYIETSASAYKLSDNELAVAGDPRFAAMARALQISPLFASGILSGQTGGMSVQRNSTPSAWAITYDYPFWAALDWGIMRQRAAWLRSVGCNEIIGEYTCAQLATYAATPFQIPGRGTYGFWVYYNSPCAVDPDIDHSRMQYPFNLTY